MSSGPLFGGGDFYGKRHRMCEPVHGVYPKAAAAVVSLLCSRASYWCLADSFA